jgi:biotin operon repressor
MRYKIFISSVQQEFADERRMLSDYLRNDALFRKFFDTFIFEDIPAQDQRPDNLYLREVEQSDIYIALLGKEFGHEFEDGTSPTQQEFEAATNQDKFRLIFLLDIEAVDRHPKMNLFIRQLSDNLVYGKFSSCPELLSGIYASLVSFLVDKGELRVEPFDRSPNRDLSIDKLKSDHASYPRNPLIAETLYFARYIEKMGTGIQDMVKLCVEYGLSEPEFKITDSFVTTIYRKEKLAFEKAGGKLDVTENVIEDVTEDVTENRENLVLELIRSDSKISTTQVARQLNTTRRTIHRELAKLKEKGLLERIGPDKGGYWQINEKDN